MAQEQDKVIRRTEGNLVVQADPDIMQIALNLGRADANKDGKVNKDEMLDFMLLGLPSQARNLLRQRCINPNDKDIVLYQNAMEKASIVAVNMGLVEEVVMPGVPSLCAKARNHSQSI